MEHLPGITRPFTKAELDAQEFAVKAAQLAEILAAQRLRWKNAS